ncbi:MAG: hypothetical protein WC023_15950 [Rhodocyclaceae bacterium]
MVFPHFLFSGEEDTDTAGLCSASSCNQNEVVIAEAEPDEWNNLESTWTLVIEKRLAQQLGRTDLKVLRLLRVERETTPAAGLSFREFHKGYKSPMLVYSCACCGKGESRVIEELTVGDFKKSGGQILVTGRLTL